MTARLQYQVCATPRSGSGLLCDALRSTGAAGDPQEWFARGVVHHKLVEWQLDDPASTPETPVMRAGGDYAGLVRSAATVDGVFALKLHWNQWDYFTGGTILPDLNALRIDEAGPLKAVLITRHNLVDQAVSSLIAQSTHVFQQWVGEPAKPTLGFEHLPSHKPRYDYAWLLDQIIRLAEHEAAWVAFLAEHGIPHHRVIYEDLVSDLAGTCTQVLQFLGVPDPGKPPTPRLVKQGGPMNLEFAEQFRRDFTASGGRESLTGHMLERFGFRPTPPDPAADNPGDISGQDTAACRQHNAR